MRPNAARLALVVVAAAAAVTAVPASAADGGMCRLEGTAAFKQGPSMSDHAFSYTFTGDLSSCQSSGPAVPASGTIATLTPAVGTGTCGTNSTAGLALVTWADKTLTVVKYSTTSATAGVELEGSVVPSATVGKKTYKTTRFADYSAAGLLFFQANPQECAGGGVTTSPISGLVGLGHE